MENVNSNDVYKTYTKNVEITNSKILKTKKDIFEVSKHEVL